MRAPIDILAEIIAGFALPLLSVHTASIFHEFTGLAAAAALMPIIDFSARSYRPAAHVL